MVTRCPGCLMPLSFEAESAYDRVLLKCPECFYIFLVDGPSESAAQEEPADEATVLLGDFKPEGDISEFCWNVPGASLTVIEGENQGIHYKIRADRVTIGREDADLTLADPALSRRHLEIVREGESYQLRDLESKNGTYLNGRRITEAKLAHMDEIWAGKSRILFALLGGPEDQPQPDAGEEREKFSREDRTKVEPEDAEREHTLPPNREFFLEFMQGAKKGRSFKFPKGRIIIGRSSECDLVLDDVQTSRRHAMIEVLSREHIFMTDLASANGAYLNGVRIRTTRLKHEDKIRLGNSVLKFVVKDIP